MSGIEDESWPENVQFSSVQSLDRMGRLGAWGTIQQRSSSSLFCRGPFWAVLAWAGMSTLWCCPTSISSADQGVAHSPRSPEGWFWRGFRGVWHAWTMQVSVSWQLPENVPVDPQVRRSCPAPRKRKKCEEEKKWVGRLCMVVLWTFTQQSLFLFASD